MFSSVWLSSVVSSFNISMQALMPSSLGMLVYRLLTSIVKVLRCQIDWCSMRIFV